MSDVPAERKLSRTSTHTRLPQLWVWPARAVWLICVGLIVYTMIANGSAYFRDWQSGGPLTESILRGQLVPEVFFPIETICAGLMVLVYFVSGLMIATRRNDDWLTLSTSLFLMSYAAYIVFRYYQLQAAPLWVDLFLDTLLNLTWFTFGALFPNGKPQPRWIGWVLGAGFFYILGANLIFPHLFYNFPEWHLVIRESAFNFVVVGAQIYRYFRVATPVQRQQSKWTVLGFAFGVVGDTVLSIGGLRAGAGMTAYLILRPIATVFLLFGVLSLMAAITRYRLWDIDFVISRSLVYGGLTVLLGALFVGVFFGAQRLLELVLGDQQMVVAGGVSAVVVALTFGPARTALRRFVDHRIYGIEIDYRKAVKDEKRLEIPAYKPGDTRTSFGEFSGLTLVGRGGMGEVYRGEHPTLNHTIAIKILPSHAAENETAQKRFIREAQTISALKHPNIVSLHDVGEYNGTAFMVMEYIDGLSLGDMIRQDGRLSMTAAMPILRDISSALDYAHASGVIHRDIKPSNVMVEKTTADKQRAVLMDFGIAKSYASSTQLTQSGMIGTLDYIPPEQIQGNPDVDGRADIYSLSVMAFQMLTGKLPFEHNNPGAMVLAHLMQPPPDPRQSAPDMTESAAASILRGLAKKPEQRFATAGEFMAALAM